MQSIRVSCGSLCRFMIGGQLLVVLNRNRRQHGRFVLSPIGGGIEFHDLGFMQGLNIRLQDPSSNDLRFIIPVDQLETFRQWFYRREGRETDPFREIYEEVVEEEAIVNKLRREDLTIQFLRTAEEVRMTDRQGSTDLLTQYFLELYDVRPVDPAPYIIASQTRDDVVLIDEITARQEHPVRIDVDGVLRNVRLRTRILFEG